MSFHPVRSERTIGSTSHRWRAMRFLVPNRSLRNSPPSATGNKSLAQAPGGPLRRRRNPRRSFPRTHRTSSHPGSDSAFDKTDGLPPSAAPRSASTTLLAEPACFVVPSPCSKDDQNSPEVTLRSGFSPRAARVAIGLRRFVLRDTTMSQFASLSCSNRRFPTSARLA